MHALRRFRDRRAGSRARKRFRVTHDQTKRTNEPVDKNSHDKRQLEKKPYKPPVLIEWGTLEELKHPAGWSGKNDGGRFIFTKPG